MNRPASSCYWVVNRVTTDAGQPRCRPEELLEGGAKSFDDIPCKYIEGSTSATFGLLRAPGGKIELRNRHR